MVPCLDAQGQGEAAHEDRQVLRRDTQQGKEMRQGRRTAEMGWVVELERRTDGKLFLQAGLCRKRDKQLCVVLVLEKTRK